MRQNISEFWNDVTSSSNIEQHRIYEVHMLDSIPDIPAIYAWYLIVDGFNFSDYYKLYKQKKIQITLNGSLSVSYEGEAKSVYSEKDFKDLGVDHDLCNVASLAFSPPLYIGISKRLGTRMREHYQELKEIYYSSKPLLPSPSLGKTDFDTIFESQHFAQRIGHSIKNHSKVNLSALRVKTIEMPAAYKWQDLQLVEKYLNRTYIPIYGRK